MFLRGKCVEWKTRNLIKVDANRIKELIMENDVTEMIGRKDQDEIRGEMN